MASKTDTLHIVAAAAVPGIDYTGPRAAVDGTYHNPNLQNDFLRLLVRLDLDS